MEIILYVAFFAIVATFVYAGLRGAPWVPSKKKDVERFLKLADIKPGDKMYDLGCGDGRLVIESAKAGAIAQGLEISLLPYFIANISRLFQKNKKNVKISYKDIWSADLRDADVIYFFLMPKIYPKLKEKFEKELRPGTKIVAYVWPIVGWIPKKTSTHPNHPNLYLYEI